MNINAIPVDLTNPGQVLACMGFLEASDTLLGPTEARFDWQSGEARFLLQTEASENPFADVLAFVAEAKAIAVVPRGWLVPSDISQFVIENTFPSIKADKNTLPIILKNARNQELFLSHWVNQSIKDKFKLYTGNRSAQKIANAMILAIADLWGKKSELLLVSPFNQLCSMGGSFNFDPRGAWKSLDVGYSINDLKQNVVASPLVELLAACGLQHARFAEHDSKYRYVVWDCWLPPQLARVALSGELPLILKRSYQFVLDSSGENKIVCYAIQENTP